MSCKVVDDLFGTFNAKNKPYAGDSIEECIRKMNENAKIIDERNRTK